MARYLRLVLATLVTGLPAATALGGDIFVPGDLSPGDEYHVAFLTFSGRDTSSDEIADYNAFVQAQAEQSGAVTEGWGVDWFAVASTSSIVAKDNVPVEAAPVYLLSDVRLADGATDLWDGSIQNPFSVNQFGQVESNQNVWTGTAADGMALVALGGAEPRHGFSGFMTGDWVSFGNEPNDIARAMYAISAVLTVPGGEPGLVIDPFDGPEQQAPPDSDVEAPSAIGGRRFMSAMVALTGIVSESEGHLTVINASEFGGVVTVEWNGGGTLGGVDLTDGGSNEFIDIVTELVSVGAVLETLTFCLTDSVGGESSVEISFVELSPFSSNLIPFTSLEGDADLTSIDVICLSIEIIQTNILIEIDSISAVPGDCVGDTNGDSQVDGLDLDNVIDCWGTKGADCPGMGDNADVDGNGTVNVNDLIAVIVGWGACP